MYRKTRFQNVRWRGAVLYFVITNEHGHRQEIKFGEGTPAEARDAQRIAQERADRIRAGLIDPREEAMRQRASRPVAETVAEYRQHLHGKGDTAHHVKVTIRYIERWAKECDLRSLAEADAARLNRWLTDLGRSARTRNAARASVLGLCRWAADYGRIQFNPCPAGLIPKSNEEADRRRLSRAMTPAQFEALLKGTTPRRRAFYLLAGTVGIRWSELARARWVDVDLDVMAIEVPAGQSKTKRRADLPIHDRPRSALLAIRSDRPASAAIFGSAPTHRTWIRDLERAHILHRDGDGNLIDYVDELGRRLDRKCLRMSCCTWLKHAGVDLRDAQRVMRHSSPKLTANVYTDIRMPALRSAIDKIGMPPAGKAQAAAG